MLEAVHFKVSPWCLRPMAFAPGANIFMELWLNIYLLFLLILLFRNECQMLIIQQCIATVYINLDSNEISLCDWHKLGANLCFWILKVTTGPREAIISPFLLRRNFTRTFYIAFLSLGCHASVQLGLCFFCFTHQCSR